MEIHICILSTMTPRMTKANLNASGVEFDETEGIVQKFRWSRGQGAYKVTLWVACLHPVVNMLASSFIPYMDACVCWYHDHDGLSCARVAATMALFERYASMTRLMVTTMPRLQYPHKSNVRKYYNKLGFEHERLQGTFAENVEHIVQQHFTYKKHLDELYMF